MSGGRDASIGAPAVAGRMAFPPAPDAVLTRADVAAWLKIKPRQVQRLGIPFFDLGLKTKRYLAKDVLTWLDSRRGLPSVATPNTLLGTQ